MIEKEGINIVWLKRDLRLNDNEAIHNSLKTSKRTLLVYIFENILLEDEHYSDRHWNFVKQSIENLNAELAPYNSKVLTVKSDVISTFNLVQSKYNIDSVYSHKETGLLVTFERDKNFTRYCRNNRINWQESDNNGVKRGLKDRKYWFEGWNAYMNDDILNFNPEKDQLLTIHEVLKLEDIITTISLKTEQSRYFQRGGSLMAWKYADSFLNKRHKDYVFNISKPELSRSSCSRLSPYISWGNISIRELCQKGKYVKENGGDRRQLSAFLSRLRWQAHFIQKFEMEHTMEKASVNKGYHKLKKNVSIAYQTAWENGKTGFPLIDASMRCLNTTGYLNFRMRAMLVSFFTHILWQPWQDATKHLSRMFLDFEPGIHFPQIQMQAGETGINNLRIYNPIKNSIDHDPEGVFIKKWVPELSNLEINFVHQPYTMTFLEEQFHNFKIGINYPRPIVDIKETRKKAIEILWNMKKNTIVQQENKRILKKHTLKDRSRMLKGE